jgi:hypothetical protein
LKERTTPSAMVLEEELLQRVQLVLCAMLLVEEYIVAESSFYNGFIENISKGETCSLITTVA